MLRFAFAAAVAGAAALWSSPARADIDVPPPAAPPPPVPVEPFAPGRVGAMAVLAGPVGNYGLAGIYQLHPMVELHGGAVMQAPEVSNQQGNVSGTGKATVVTPFARARLFPFDRHNLIGEAGLGAMHYSLEVVSRDTQGNSLTYTRGGNLPLAFGGAGYGYRNSSVRFSVLMGYMAFLGKADASSLVAVGPFSSSTVASTKSQLDSVSDNIGKSRPYIELSFGFMF